MIEPDVPLPPPEEKGTKRRRAFAFAATIAAVLVAFGAWKLHRGSVRGAAGLGAASVLLVLYSVVHPAGALVLRSLWLRLGGLLGRINTVIILSVAYFVLLTPLSLLMRLFRRQSPFARDPKEPYFTPRTDRDPKHFDHPY